MSQKRDKAHIEDVENIENYHSEKKTPRKLDFNYRHVIKCQGHNGTKNKDIRRRQCAINGASINE